MAFIFCIFDIVTTVKKNCYICSTYMRGVDLETGASRTPFRRIHQL